MVRILIQGVRMVATQWDPHWAAAGHRKGTPEGDKSLVVFIQPQARLATAHQLYERRPARG